MKANELPPLNKASNTRLQPAVFCGDIMRVHFLVQVLKCHIPTSILHTAAGNGNITPLRYFIENRFMNPTTPSINDNVPLHMAALNSQYESVKYLMEYQQVDPLVLNKEYYSPLHKACEGGDLTYLMKNIQQHGPVDVQEKIRTGQNILHLSAISGNKKLVEFLLTGGSLQNDVCFPPMEKCDVHSTENVSECVQCKTIICHYSLRH